MTYPGPPGVSKPSSHPSLPPRPPTTKLPGFKPAFSTAPPAISAPGFTAPAPSYSGYGPATAPPPASYGGPTSASSYTGNPPAPVIGGGRGGYNQTPTYNSYPQSTYAQQPSYYGTAANTSYSTPPQIRNPFPAPDAAGSDFDPEMAAQIAQWQSAYMPKDPSDPSAKATGVSGRAGAGTLAPGAQAAPVETIDAGASGEANEKKKTVYREGGGKKWQDDSLLEWDPAHLRLFVGNLAGETTDDSLLKAFSRWKSVQKAKVIRDKRTTKSKGFGFVSFSDPEDFFQAAKEMNGKYIQSHPVVVRKAKTEIKPQVVKEDRKGKNHKRGGGGNKSGSGRGTGQDGAGAYEPHLGPMGGGGITKPGQKTKGGLKLLG
ncbi:RNA-binding protein 42 [Madurella mycetomatis]|uniref:RNA-binding protein 42 n=1 Tax=Madurella mycetomatis TaxID=100816 RepID=A0A175W9Y4_9PEZI|nr:RNA-binding protein 42 [Madurella mycetomatis]